MRDSAGAIRPLFDEHQAQRVLAVDMNRMRDAAGFGARAMDVLEAEFF